MVVDIIIYMLSYFGCGLFATMILYMYHNLTDNKHLVSTIYGRIAYIFLWGVLFPLELAWIISYAIYSIIKNGEIL